jgi:hypothetical protein
MWRDQLFMNVGYAWTDYRWPPRTYMEVENHALVWIPEPPASDVDSPK